MQNSFYAFERTFQTVEIKHSKIFFFLYSLNKTYTKYFLISIMILCFPLSLISLLFYLVYFYCFVLPF